MNVVLLRVLVCPRPGGRSLGWRWAGSPRWAALVGDPRVGMTGIFLSLSRILPDSYPLGDDVDLYVALEHGFGHMLDIGVILPRIVASTTGQLVSSRYRHCARLLDDESPSYAWDAADAAIWRFEPSRLARVARWAVPAITRRRRTSVLRRTARIGRRRSAPPARRPAANPEPGRVARCRSSRPHRVPRGLPEKCCHATHPAGGREPGGQCLRNVAPGAAGPCPRGIRASAMRSAAAGTGRSAVHVPCTPSHRTPSAPPRTAGAISSSGSRAATSPRSRADGDPASWRPCTARATTLRTFVSTTGTRCR